MNSVLTRRSFVALAASGLVLGRASNAFSQSDYPSRDMTFYVGYGPGGHSDMVARTIGEHLQARWGQAAITDYRPGGGGALAGDLVARAEPDGYSLLAVSNTFYAVTPFLGHVTYEPLRDLVPVGFAGDGYLIAAVHPSLPVNTLDELVEYARQNPGQLNYASNGQGSLTHLCGEYFKSRAGVDLQHIPYRGAADAVQSTIRNETQVNFSIGDAGFHNRGELRAISSLGPERWDALPDVPASDEGGMKNWEIRSWHGIAVPYGTPVAVQEKLNTEINEIIQLPEVIERLATLGLRLSPQSLEQLDERRRRDHAAFGTVIQEAGIVIG